MNMQIFVYDVCVAKKYSCMNMCIYYLTLYCTMLYYTNNILHYTVYL